MAKKTRTVQWRPDFASIPESTGVDARVSMLVLSGIFSFVMYLLVYALSSQTINDIIGTHVTANALANASILILAYLIFITGIVMAAGILSGVPVAYAILTGLISFVMNAVLFGLISYLSLAATNPSIFYHDGQELPSWFVALQFPALITRWVAYVAKDQNAIFLPAIFLTIGISFVLDWIMRGFDKK